jgi:hypothetical protein
MISPNVTINDGSSSIRPARFPFGKPLLVGAILGQRLLRLVLELIIGFFTTHVI